MLITELNFDLEIDSVKKAAQMSIKNPITGFFGIAEGSKIIFLSQLRSPFKEQIIVDKGSSRRSIGT
jgi:hypothetical protein